MSALLTRIRVDEPNMYGWGFVADEPCHVLYVGEWADGYRAYVEWMPRPDGLVRPSGWVRVDKLATCPVCAGGGVVPSASGWTDTACLVCAL